MSLTAAAVKEKARELRFDVCGVARAEKHPKLARLAEWIAEGRAGEMSYLGDSLAERLDPAHVLPTARSIVSVGVVYHTDHPCSNDATPPGHVAIARYAWGDDYHAIIQARLRDLLRWMATEAGPGLEGFTCVDHGPLQERVYAEQAGLGWIGKNTCLINPALGSWMFLGEVITNAEVEADSPGIDQCGACTRCIDACPTGAIVAPQHELDATRCLSYLTIEQRGAVDEALRPLIRQQVYGCDICQDVCPWNRRVPVSEDDAWQPREGLAFPRLVDLCRLTDAAWIERLKGSAMKRAGLHRIRRSLAYACDGLPAADAEPALAALEAEPSGTQATVADAIHWARNRLAAR